METILIGTYTRKTSEGIYRVELNTHSNTLENRTLVAKTQNPTYLEYLDNTNQILAVYQEGDEAGIALWDYKDNIATLNHTITQTGSSPCFVHFDANRNEYYDANYHKGEVHVYQDDKLKETFVYPNEARAHYVHTDAKTGALFTVDLGNDTIHKYIDLKEASHYKAKKASGPRHIAFHPHAPYLYIMSEYSNEVVVLKDGETLEEIQVIDSIEKGVKSDGAAIRISPCGKYLYTSTRGHDSITVFKIENDYRLSIIQNISTFGEHPRDFNLTKDGRYCVVANRDTNNLVLYARDLDSGLLEKLSEIEVPEPVNLIFI